MSGIALVFFHLGAAAQQQGENGIPQTACVGCDPSGWLDRHVVSPTDAFYCRPGPCTPAPCPGNVPSLPECQVHTAEECCAGCLKLHEESDQCDAWFMNQQGGCFFKKCPPEAWLSGACHIDWEDNTQKYVSGIAPRVGGSCQWGQWTILALLCVGQLYIGVGVSVGVRLQGKPPALTAHPHYPMWQEVVELARDGMWFTRISLLRAAGKADARAPHERRAVWKDREYGTIPRSHDAPPNAKEQKRSRGERKENRSEKSRAREHERGEAKRVDATPSGAVVGEVNESSAAAVPLAGTPSAGGGRWVHVPG